MPHPIDLLAPGEPAAVRCMDTVWADRAGVHDALTDSRDLRALLAATGLLSSPAERRITRADVARARRLRDALRRLAAAVTEDTRERAAVDLSERQAVVDVNAVLAAAPPPALERSASGWCLRVEADSVAGALAALAREGAVLVADPDRPLRACYAPGCVLYFVKDHPRREWCSTECGNRVRAARHYARVRHRDR